MSAELISWDWKEAAPVDEIIAAIRRVTGVPNLFMRDVDTQSDQYAVVISDAEITDGEADAMYRAGWDE